jgi:hypothetical protein
MSTTLRGEPLKALTALSEVALALLLQQVIGEQGHHGFHWGSEARLPWRCDRRLRPVDG